MGDRETGHVEYFCSCNRALPVRLLRVSAEENAQVEELEDVQDEVK